MNTKHPLYKEKLQVQRDMYELEKIQDNQNWIELDKPIKNGYYKVWDLRDDIKNRDDAWVFYECIRLVGERIWYRDKSFRKKIRKGKYEYVSPGFGYISDKVYDGLVPAVKKHFVELSFYDKNYNHYFKRYKCTVHSYYFVEKVKAKWITHYKEVDSVIESKINEKRDELWSKKFYDVQIWSDANPPKWFIKPYHRSDRRNSKQTVRKNMNFGVDDFSDYEYRYHHKNSARWDYW